MITICFTYFKSLRLANLAAALFSVRQQEFADVQQVVILDNDTENSVDAIQNVVRSLAFPVPVTVHSYKHGDPSKTHAWSTNTVVREVATPWVVFTRADYILDFTLVQRFSDVIRRHSECFVTGDGCHLHVPVETVEETAWRERGACALRDLHGTVFNYTKIDTGVWMTTRRIFDSVGGLDEGLTAWGHAQTYFQYLLYKAGVEFVRIPEVLYFHPSHGAPRDIAVAHQQLSDRGIDIRELWARYEGGSPY